MAGVNRITAGADISETLGPGRREEPVDHLYHTEVAAHRPTVSPPAEQSTGYRLITRS